MILHLIRLVWNRRGRNGLVALEILCAFLVLVAVTGYGAHLAGEWRRPLGFSIDRVWMIAGRPPDHPDRQAFTEIAERLLAAVQAAPAVEAASAVSGGAVPYGLSSQIFVVSLDDGRRLLYFAGAAGDDFAEIMGINLVAGRWFSPDDDATAAVPVVINARMARAIFGDRDPVGASIPARGRIGGFVPESTRIVGVIEDFRKNGEFAASEPFLFHRSVVSDGARRTIGGTSAAAVFPVDRLVIRVAPGTTAAVEEDLLARARTVAPDWSFEVRTLDSERSARLGRYRVALLVSGTVAAFLLLMVALGLTGVVWQSVTERTHEFGLRRANGATVAGVRRQVIAELAVLASMALAAGLLIVLQVAALPLPAAIAARLLSQPVFGGSVRVLWSGALAAGTVASVVLIYVMTFLCAWYPSRLATKIQPAEALHYD